MLPLTLSGSNLGVVHDHRLVSAAACHATSVAVWDVPPTVMLEMGNAVRAAGARGVTWATGAGAGVGDGARGRNDSTQQQRQHQQQEEGHDDNQPSSPCGPSLMAHAVKNFEEKSLKSAFSNGGHRFPSNHQVVYNIGLFLLELRGVDEDRGGSGRNRFCIMQHPCLVHHTQKQHTSHPLHTSAGSLPFAPNSPSPLPLFVDTFPNPPPPSFVLLSSSKRCTTCTTPSSSTWCERRCGPGRSRCGPRHRSLPPWRHTKLT